MSRKEHRASAVIGRWPIVVDDEQREEREIWQKENGFEYRLSSFHYEPGNSPWTI